MEMSIPTDPLYPHLVLTERWHELGRAQDYRRLQEKSQQQSMNAGPMAPDTGGF